MIAAGYDWLAVFYYAAWKFIQGGDPYGQLLPFLSDRFLNPPWLLPLLVPFALLPPVWGAWAINASSVVAVLTLCAKAGKPWLTLAIVVSYPMADLLYHGSVDGFCLWGLVIGGPIGLILLSTKPQVAGLVGALWAWQAYRDGGWKAVMRLIWPVIAVAVAFTAFFPQWISSTVNASQLPNAVAFNLWPWLVPVGLWALVVALRRSNRTAAIIASNLLLPYLRGHSWVAAVTSASVDYPRWAVLIAVLSWIPFLFLLLR